MMKKTEKMYPMLLNSARRLSEWHKQLIYVHTLQKIRLSLSFIVFILFQVQH